MISIMNSCKNKKKLYELITVTWLQCFSIFYSTSNLSRTNCVPLCSTMFKLQRGHTCDLWRKEGVWDIYSLSPSISFYQRWSRNSYFILIVFHFFQFLLLCQSIGLIYVGEFDWSWLMSTRLCWAVWLSTLNRVFPHTLLELETLRWDSSESAHWSWISCDWEVIVSHSHGEANKCADAVVSMGVQSRVYKLCYVC